MKGTWMPQYDNKEIMVHLLRSIIGVISRRTSEAYANVIISDTIHNLTERYSFLAYVEVLASHYMETVDVVSVSEDINFVDSTEIGMATRDILEAITYTMGKDAGHYFIKEIKEDIPYEYRTAMKNLCVDLDLLQIKFISDLRESYDTRIENSDVIKKIFNVLYKILEEETDRDFAYSSLDKIVANLKVEHDILEAVQINDARYIEGVNVATVGLEVNMENSTRVGVALQSVIEEINRALSEKGGYYFTENIKRNLSSAYILKLQHMGVNLEDIRLSQGLVLKQVLKALIDILSEANTQSWAVLAVNNVLKSYNSRFTFFSYVTIENMEASQEGAYAIGIPEEIDRVEPFMLGKGVQKIIEVITASFGKKNGKIILDKFKKRLGRNFVLIIEELGVNLHMVELRNNFLY
jgi:hypothetical protein